MGKINGGASQANDGGNYQDYGGQGDALDYGNAALMNVPELTPPSQFQPSGKKPAEKMTLKPFDIKKGGAGLKLSSKPNMVGSSGYKPMPQPVAQPYDQDIDESMGGGQSSFNPVPSQSSIPIMS